MIESQIINVGGTNDPEKGPNQGPSGQPLEDFAPHKQSIAECNNKKLTRHLSHDITVQYVRSFLSAASKDANLLVELLDIPPKVENTSGVKHPISTSQIYCSYFLCFSLSSL